MRLLVVSGSTAQLPDPVYPLGAAIIGTSALSAGHRVAWFDALQQSDTEVALTGLINSFKPEAFLFSIRNIDSGAFPNPELYFENHVPLVKLCRKLSNAPIVVGGSGFSLMPELFMASLAADVGVLGEGETVIVDILERLEAGERRLGIIKAPRANPVTQSVNRELFNAEWYYKHGGVANLQTKRGCGFNCIYCTYPLLEGHQSRPRSPEDVVDEMASMAKKGIEHFFFVDAVFNRPESHAAAICEEIIRSELKISFTAYFAPKGDLPEFPALLKRAGCNAAEFGTDSLSDPVLASLKKGFTVDQIMETAQKYNEVGIPQCHNLVLGAPGETDRTIAESVARLDKIDPRAVIVTIGLRVFPGTALEALATEREGTKFQNPPSLTPLFFIEEAVSETIVEKAASLVEKRRGWICPGLKMRYNSRYLKRQREQRGRKGVLWPLF